MAVPRTEFMLGSLEIARRTLVIAGYTPSRINCFVLAQYLNVKALPKIYTVPYDVNETIPSQALIRGLLHTHPQLLSIAQDATNRLFGVDDDVRAQLYAKDFYCRYIKESTDALWAAVLTRSDVRHGQLGNAVARETG